MKKALFILITLLAISSLSLQAQLNNLTQADPNDGSGNSSSNIVTLSTTPASKIVQNEVLKATIHYNILTKKNYDTNEIYTVPEYRFSNFSLLDGTFEIVYNSGFSARDNKVYFSIKATKPAPGGFVILRSVGGPVIMD